jgi:type II secretory pathway pseudopilin PulG
MGNNRRAGFTIIETMLFLGVSSLLIVLLLTGTGAAINTQRYQDASESLKSLLQQQYADVNSVENSRDNTWSCGTSASPSNSGSTADNRGQSKCILLGKYVRLENEKISVYKVVAYQKATTVQANDIESLKANYNLNIAKDNVDKSTMEWGTQIAHPVNSGVAPNPRKVGILIIRSPDSGQIYTFTNSDSDVPADGTVGSVSLANMLIAGNSLPGQGARLICIDSGGMFATNDRGVYLLTYAASSGAVELQTNAIIEDDGISSLRC